MDYDTELERLQAALNFDAHELKLNRVGKLSGPQQLRFNMVPKGWSIVWAVLGIPFIPLTYYTLIASTVNAFALDGRDTFPIQHYIAWLTPVAIVAAMGIACFVLSFRQATKAHARTVTGTVKLLEQPKRKMSQARMILVNERKLHLPTGVTFQFFHDQAIYTMYYTNNRKRYVVSAEPGDALGIAKKKKKRG